MLQLKVFMSNPTPLQEVIFQDFSCIPIPYYTFILCGWVLFSYNVMHKEMDEMKTNFKWWELLEFYVRVS